MLKKEPKQRKQEGRTSKEMIVFDHLTTHNSKVLNNELNWRNTDWAKEASEIKSLLAKSKKIKRKKPLDFGFLSLSLCLALQWVALFVPNLFGSSGLFGMSHLVIFNNT